jgi:hypothetical protein
MEPKPILQSKTVWTGILMGLVPVLLQYLAGIDWTQVLDPQYAGIPAGLIMIALRLVTSAPVGRAK